LSDKGKGLEEKVWRLFINYISLQGNLFTKRELRFLMDAQDDMYSFTFGRECPIREA